jgi:hypothetical protein
MAIEGGEASGAQDGGQTGIEGRGGVAIAGGAGWNPFPGADVLHKLVVEAKAVEGVGGGGHWGNCRTNYRISLWGEEVG